MGWIGDAFDSLCSLNIRQALTQFVNLGPPRPPPTCFHRLPFFELELPHRWAFRSILLTCFSAVPGMVVALAVMAWKCLICVTGTESPVVVVLSGSMEPGFQRGDILFLNMGKEPIRAGEIVVFNFNTSEIPIVHRVIELHERQDTREISILTKGDNNGDNDRVLYPKGHLWVQKQHIMGRAIGFLPYVGWITIVLTEIPVVKYLLIGALCLLALTSKE